MLAIDVTSHKTQNSPLLQFFPEIYTKDLDRFVSPAAISQVGPKHTIFSEGDPADFLCLIISGAVKTYKLLPNGLCLITQFFGPGDIVGMSTLGRHAYTGETLTKATLVSVSVDKLRELMAEEPSVTARMLSLANCNLLAAQQNMVLLGRKNPLEKMAHFLLEMADDAEATKEGEIRIRLAMSREDISDYLGLTIETVSRTLRKLKSDNIIGVEGTRVILIKNIARLSRLADSFEI